MHAKLENIKENLTPAGNFLSKCSSKENMKQSQRKKRNAKEVSDPHEAKQ